MRRPIVLVAASCLLLPAAPPAHACGDKFVRVGRGTRFQRGYVALHPATVLLYLGSSPAGAKAVQSLEPVLKAAGHKALAVSGPRELANAVQGGKYDLVVADVADVPSVEREAQAAPQKPAVLPIMNKPSKQARVAAEKQYACTVSDVDKKYDVLVEIDRLMEKR